MPLYKYRCDECDNTFKVLKKNGKKDEAPKCPECGSEEVERLISSVGIRFKGSGFYRTDYGGNGSYKGNGGSDPEKETSGNGNGKSKDTEKSRSKGSDREDA